MRGNPLPPKKSFKRIPTILWNKRILFNLYNGGWRIFQKRGFEEKGERGREKIEGGLQPSKKI